MPVSSAQPTELLERAAHGELQIANAAKRVQRCHTRPLVILHAAPNQKISHAGALVRGVDPAVPLRDNVQVSPETDGPGAAREGKYPEEAVRVLRLQPIAGSERKHFAERVATAGPEAGLTAQGNAPVPHQRPDIPEQFLLMRRNPSIDLLFQRIQTRRLPPHHL